LFAAIPVLRGLSQIGYAAFFAESMAKLSERFIPRPQPVQVVTAPQPSVTREEEEPVRNFENLSQPISSVTEHTTNIIDGPPPARVKTNE
jgi:hypothetical protein